MSSSVEESDEDLIDRGRAVLAEQSFSRLLGTNLEELRRGYAVLSLPIGDDMRQQHGFVHGGVVSYLADNAMTFAGGAELGVAAVTSEMKINYLRPAMGQRMVARAKAIGTGRTQSVVRCDVFAIDDGTERLCAAAQGTVAVLKAAAAHRRVGEKS